MVSVAVVGTGFGGVGVAVRLLQAGVRDLVLFEKSDDVGGVWRENTYPGAACDVPSALYSFSFAPERAWSRRFAPQAEIHAYLRRVAAEHGVTERVRFRTEVLAAGFDERTGRWTLSLSDGTTHEADVLVTACGQLSRPAVPDLPGLDAFRGPAFHSARWRHDVDLTGQRVVVVGTGASAVQFVPEVAKRAASVTVVQRSAPWVLGKPDRVLAPAGPVRAAGARLSTYLLTEARSLGFNTEPRLLQGHALRFARRLRREVPDPVLRAAVTPTDPIGCKRILQSDDWYPTLQQPHVRLVTGAVTAVRPGGVVTADGEEHPADVLVLGTGFAATELLVPMRVTGRGGRTLAEAWRGGASAHLGTTVSGFPNLFVLYGPNTNLGHSSIVLMLEAQARYVVDAVRRLARGDVRWVDVLPEVQRASCERVQQRLRGTVFAGGCRSWYLTADGRNTQNWPGTTLEFRLRTRRVDWREYHLEPAGAPVPVRSSATLP